MTRQHVSMRSASVSLAAIALTSAAAWAGPGSDPRVTSTNGAGDVLCVSVKGTPELPTGTPTGRAAPTLLRTYPQWDYWNLDTNAVRDSAGLMHFGVRLWEYDNRIPYYDRYVIDSTGQVVETWLGWDGLGSVPAFTDANGHNVFVRPSSSSQYFGVTDLAENIHVLNTSAESTGWEVRYSKLDPQGNTVIPWTVITTGADCWNWYLAPVLNHNGRIIVTWIRDTADICAIYSDDLGVTWSSIVVLFPNAGGDQAVSVKTLVGADNSLHFVWRTRNWSTNTERLWYSKARADWTVAVDETMFYEGTAAWYPFASLDDQGSIHVTFAPTYDVATDMYYTRLRGDMDLNGAAATDARLSAIQERVFYSDPDYVHYPMNLVDANGTVHVVYEEGDYGCNTDKDLYYMALCSLAGDLNCDEVVDFDDFGIFADVFAGADNPAPAGSDATDFANANSNNDEDVDLADFTAFQAAFGSSG